jgi:hypothetical protein
LKLYRAKWILVASKYVRVSGPNGGNGKGCLSGFIHGAPLALLAVAKKENFLLKDPSKPLQQTDREWSLECEYKNEYP